MESRAGETSLRFEILGPMRAWQGDLELDLGPAKQRAVLAVLLTHANKPVQTARIVEEVWGSSRSTSPGCAGCSSPVARPAVPATC